MKIKSVDYNMGASRNDWSSAPNHYANLKHAHKKCKVNKTKKPIPKPIND